MPGLHPFSLAAGAAVAALLFKLARGFFGGVSRPLATGPVAAFLSGALYVNALVHFGHGISGETFPAPFGFALGPGLATNLSNVIWGFICFAVGSHLFRSGDVWTGNRRSEVSFLGGVVGMGILLSLIFSKR